MNPEAFALSSDRQSSVSDSVSSEQGLRLKGASRREADQEAEPQEEHKARAGGPGFMTLFKLVNQPGPCVSHYKTGRTVPQWHWHQSPRKL